MDIQPRNWKSWLTRRSEWNARGLCGNCGLRPFKEGRAQCEECLRRGAAVKVEIRQRNVAAGLCITCGKKPAVPLANGRPSRACSDCRVRARARASTPAAKAASKVRQQKTRNEVFAALLEAYGDRCACCGIKEREFLTLDHPNNDGGKIRRELYGSNSAGCGWTYYRHLQKLGFPPGLRILCYNCNCVRGRVGYCPHERQ